MPKHIITLVLLCYHIIIYAVLDHFILLGDLKKIMHL